MPLFVFALGYWFDQSLTASFVAFFCVSVCLSVQRAHMYAPSAQLYDQTGVFLEQQVAEPMSKLNLPRYAALSCVPYRHTDAYAHVDASLFVSVSHMLRLQNLL